MFFPPKLLLDSRYLAVLYVIARPLAFLLDKLLGTPIGTVYAREEFVHLVEMQRKAGALGEEQAKIMTGALNFSYEKVEDCMIPIEDVFSLDADETLDKKRVNEIFTSGYSRIPVYSGSKNNIVGLILTKDLILIDIKNQRTVGEVASIFERTPLFLKSDTTLILSSGTISDNFKRLDSSKTFSTKAQ